MCNRGYDCIWVYLGKIWDSLGRIGGTWGVSGDPLGAIWGVWGALPWTAEMPWSLG